MKTNLFLIRHGQPSLENVLLGHTNAPLNSLGEKQMSCLFDWMNKTKLDKNIDRVLTSPLVRCNASAQSFATKLNLECESYNAFQECNFGLWDGRLFSELNEEKNSSYQSFIVNPFSTAPPQGEHAFDFMERVEKGLNKVINQFKGETLALFSHAGVIRTIVAWCLGLKKGSTVPFHNLRIDYASVTRISVFHGEQVFPTLESLNEHCHLNLASETP